VSTSGALFNNPHVGHDGLVLIMRAIGPKVPEFRPGQRRWNLKGHKNPSHTSFGGEVKPSVPCRVFYGMLKNLAEYERDTL